MTLAVTSRAVLLMILGLVFHGAYMFSIFDIYFRSPVVHGMQPLRADVAALSKRVVLIVADGLRADRTFEMTKSVHEINDQPLREENAISRIPYLRSKIMEKGRWGVSHARVPTESRPGHVALISGMWEDVSAVTTGWKRNPVHFDSVFNESRYTFSWGSEDILPIFADNCPNVNASSYDPDFEDFAEEGSHLDEWVFSAVEEAFSKAKNDSVLNEQLRSDGLVLFLHLLGIDVNGHAHRPYSSYYLNNILKVDQGVERIASMLSEFYDDDETAFIFTSDHGMADRGSHGDADTANTRTPLIVWGKGFNRPVRLDGRLEEDYDHLFIPSPPEWNLTSVSRRDIDQADVAPLMSSLIGRPFPVHNVGVVPVDLLDCEDEHKARLLAANAKQISRQVWQKRELKKKNCLFTFRPFSEEESIRSNLATIDRLIAEGEFHKSMSLARSTVGLCMEGLRYFQTYDWAFLMSIITCGYISWIIVCLMEANRLQRESEGDDDTHANRGKTRVITVPIVCAVSYAILSLYCILENRPWMYLAYLAFPFLFGAIAIAEWNKGISLIRKIVLVFGLVEALVVAYFERRLLSMCIVAAMLVTYLLPTASFRLRSVYFGIFALSSAVVAIFPWLTVNYGDSPTLVCSGGIVWAIFFSMGFFTTRSTIAPSARQCVLFIVQLLSILVSVLCVHFTTISLQNGDGLPILNRLWSWSTIALPFIFPLLSDSYFKFRQLSLYMAIAPPYIMLSIHYEVMFMVALTVSMYSWTELLRHQKGTVLWASAAYLSFSYVAFFGTGNIASISSFEISSTYRFVTVFSPFTMATILLFKVLLPFVVVCASFIFGIHLQVRPGEESSGAIVGDGGIFAGFLYVMGMADMMTVNFFFLVQDSGSWKSIGESISHFCISDLFILLQLCLFLAAYRLTKGFSADLSRKEKHY